MTTLGGITSGNPFCALVYSPAKLGKTFGAGSFPRPNWLDFDSTGTDTLTSPEFINAHGWHPEIPIARFSKGTYSDKGILTKATMLDDMTTYLDTWMKPGKREQFDTWIIDTGTTLFEAAMAKAIILLGGKNASNEIGISSKTHGIALESGLIFYKKQDYGAERSMAEQFISRVLATGKNVLLLCHEEEIYNDAGQLLGYKPMLRGQSKDKVGVHFAEIYRLQVKKVGMEKTRVIRTVPHEGAQCGSRLGIPDETEWSWPAIKKALDANAAKRQGDRPPTAGPTLVKG